jgi:hypothetical protein
MGAHLRAFLLACITRRLCHADESCWLDGIVMMVREFRRFGRLKKVHLGIHIHFLTE